MAYWKGLANNGMTDEQREALQPTDPEWELRVNGSKTHVIGLLLYTTVLWLLKGCWVVYYSRMTCVRLPSERRVLPAANIRLQGRHPIEEARCLLDSHHHPGDLRLLPSRRVSEVHPL